MTCIFRRNENSAESGIKQEFSALRLHDRLHVPINPINLGKIRLRCPASLGLYRIPGRRLPHLTQNYWKHAVKTSIILTINWVKHDGSLTKWKGSLLIRSSIWQALIGGWVGRVRGPGAAAEFVAQNPINPSSGDNRDSACFCSHRVPRQIGRYGHGGIPNEPQKWKCGRGANSCHVWIEAKVGYWM